MNPIEQVVTEEGKPQDGAEAVEQTPSDGSFELSLLLPNDVTLNIPAIALTDSIRDIALMISESENGITLGAFGLVPVVARPSGTPTDADDITWGPWSDIKPPTPPTDASVVDPSIWRLTKEGVLGEFTDMALVFAGDDWANTKRGLRVVNVSYTPLSLSAHLLRLRDTIYAASPTVARTAAYDPTTVAIAAGATVYSTVRGDVPVEPEAAMPEKSSKKSKAAAAAPPTPDADAAPDANTVHPFTNWTLESLKPFDSFIQTQPPTTTSTASPCARYLAVSAWSPPPHPLRLRGHIIYLTFSTLEGEIFHITGATSGFWVSKSGLHTFDPSPRYPAPPGVQSTPYHSLFDLFSALSPIFAKGLVSLLEQQNPNVALTNLYATLPVTHAAPAASWLVAAPVHHSDPFRTQLAYLLTTTTKAELLPAARDWNDELVQFKELPSTTLADKLYRERLLSRVQSEFVSAATQGAIAIERGDITALNPNESEESHTYIHNNMLYTRADDAVGGFSHVGGNAASRVAASKDLRGVGSLEKLDIDGLHTMATLLVDIGGKRWVVQSIIPGLLSNSSTQSLEAEEAKQSPDKSDEENAAIAADKPFPSIETLNKDDYPPQSVFRIVYGSVNPELPDEKVRSSKFFGSLAQQIAKGLHLAEHTVSDAEGAKTSLWTSTDCHGIAGQDGRSYLLDCFRLHCVDVEYLENDITGPISPSTTTDAQSTPYPHRLVFLRSELIQSYRDSKLQTWIEGQLLAAQERIAASAAKAEAEGTVATSNGSTETPARPPQSIINAADFELDFNPDAFVERKPTSPDAPSLIIYDPEAESTKSVRDASVWLRTVALPTFIVDVVANQLGASLSISRVMHRKGINMRYLGLIAGLVERDGATYDYGKSVDKSEIALELKSLTGTLQHEMIARAAKHILNRLLLSSNSYDHANLVSHFLNCLLGAALESHPVAVLPKLPEGVNADRTWSNLTPAALRSQLLTEVKSRFRYTLPSAALEGDLRRVRLLKGISTRVGIQLLLRVYEFGDVSKVATNGASESEPEVQAVEVEVANEASKKKKKASGKKAKELLAAPSQLVSFYPEDVLNLMPVVKYNTHKSIACDATFAAGRAAFSEGDLETGQDAAHNALAMYEQIYGPLHAIAASKTHSLGIIYQQLFSVCQRKLANSNEIVQAMAEMTEEEREASRPQLEKEIVENVEGMRAQAELYLDSSIRSIRQALVISERCVGLDDSETAECYTNLALVEQSGNNSMTALRLIKHAIGLYVVNYGPDHPTILRLLNHACLMIQTLTGLIGPAIPLMFETRRLAEKIYGKESTAYGNACYSLSQSTAMEGDFQLSASYALEAAASFEATLGADSEPTVEAKKFVSVIISAISQRQAQADNQALAIQQQKQKAAARLQAQAPVGARGLRNGRLGAASSTPKTPELVAEVEPVPPTSTRGSLSVEELVDFITGAKPKPASTKAKKKRAASSKA